MKMHERLRSYRKELGLSQDYISKLLDVSRTTITAIESGERKVSSDELRLFSEIYGVSSDEILTGRQTFDSDTKMFARTFSTLSENDKREIMYLIDFKKKLKGQ